jgi:hypothetical protein
VARLLHSSANHGGRMIAGLRGIRRHSQSRLNLESARFYFVTRALFDAETTNTHQDQGPLEGIKVWPVLYRMCPSSP